MGKRRGFSVLQDLGEKECPSCGNMAAFTAKLFYRYRHLWYLCSWISQREYVAECAGCGNCLILDKEESKHRWPKASIPFYRQWGWVPFVVLLFIIIGSTVASNRAQSERTAAYLASPQSMMCMLSTLPLCRTVDSIRTSRELPEKGTPMV